MLKICKRKPLIIKKGNGIKIRPEKINRAHQRRRKAAEAKCDIKKVLHYWEEFQSWLQSDIPTKLE